MKSIEIDCNLLFSYKISRFTCVCAFFVVPLQSNLEYYGHFYTLHILEE